MSLLARVSRHLGATSELLATDALGELLLHPDCAGLFREALTIRAPALPDGLRFLTQVRAEDATRPDVVGLFGEREVVHVEGKFWAQLTAAQPAGYLDRLRDQRLRHAAQDSFGGILVFVCPIQRAGELWAAVVSLADAEPRATVGSWRIADTTDGCVLALTDWQTVLGILEQAETAAAREDVRQLRGLVDDVSTNSFQPWTLQEIGERHWPRQVVHLIDVCREVRGSLLAAGAATRPPGKRLSVVSSIGMYGFPVYLGGCYVSIGVDLRLWAEHGHGPLWLTFFGHSQYARAAFPADVLPSSYQGVSIPLPLSPGMLREEMIAELEKAVASRVPGLAQARSAAQGDGDGLPTGIAATAEEDEETAMPPGPDMSSGTSH